MSITRQAGQLKSVKAKADNGGTFKASVSGPASAPRFADETVKLASPARGTVDTNKLATVVKAADVASLVKAIAARSDAAQIMAALFMASQSK